MSLGKAVRDVYVRLADPDQFEAAVADCAKSYGINPVAVRERFLESYGRADEVCRKKAERADPARLADRALAEYDRLRGRFRNEVLPYRAFCGTRMKDGAVFVAVLNDARRIYVFTPPDFQLADKLLDSDGEEFFAWVGRTLREKLAAEHISISDYMRNPGTPSYAYVEEELRQALFPFYSLSD